MRIASSCWADICTSRLGFRVSGWRVVLELCEDSKIVRVCRKGRCNSFMAILTPKA